MNNFSKSQIGRDYTCRSHSARPDRAELYRICPSKLSKRELEDLYFALLENNLELKRALNGQQDKIKVLSTKVQRMTATQKNAQGKETKECCVATKAIVCEQKNSIADLKTANERMAERIRLLNMRLCSARQFLRRGPCGQAATRCSRCCNTPAAASLKNSSTSALLAKRSEGNLKPCASSQYIDKDICATTRSVETETQEEEKATSNRPCDENKCRTLMEELQQKIVNLEEELSNTHEEYSNRISRLEREVLEVRKENVVARSERLASEHELQQRVRRSGELMTTLRAAEANCNELTMQLSIEKRKVAELETQLKAANMSNKVAKSIEDHLSNAPHTQRFNESKPDRDETILPKSTEDSGYIDANRSQDLVDDKGLDKLNEDLIRKISDLETQLDYLKLSTAAELANEKGSSRSLQKALDGINIKEIEDNVAATINKYDEVLMELEKSPSNANNEERMTTGSRNDTSITNGTEANVEPDTRPITPPPSSWEDVPSTSKKACNCSAKYGDLNKEEPAETVSKDSTLKETQLSSSNPDQHELESPGPEPQKDSVWNKGFLKKLSVELKTRNTQKYLTKNNSVQDNLADGSTTTPGAECISRSTKTTNLNEHGSMDQTNMPAPSNSNTEATNAASNDVKTQSTLDRATDDRDFDTNTYPKDAPDTCSIKSRDSLQVNRHRWCKDSEPAVKEQTRPSMHNLYSSFAHAESCSAPGRELAHAHDRSPIEFCESQSRVCTCPTNRHRAVSMFRTCSGTLRFTTLDAGCPKFRTCDCGGDDYSHESCGPKVSGGTQAGPQKAMEGRGRRSSSVRSVSQVLKYTRATSPENTDNEISSMTDLPSEKDAKSPRAALSPGEDKATTTYTDSYTTPITTDYGSLSEGELPTKNTVRRVSIGEKTNINAVPAESSSQKMEAALQAITEELARCKELLLSQKHEEPTPVSREGSGTARAAACPRPVALRRAVATQSIGDAQAPKCVFTLHIGTVVLSDEAVLNSRNKTLMLSWQFYDQAVAMTRMRAGRVVLFDFSTEYDIKITDDFLEYMKRGEMPLVICELDKRGEPFASCALPLRDALLHTNRRADMSLALVAGCKLQSSTADALDAGDELGVLDLWCMLRAEPRQLPAIHRAMVKPSVDIGQEPLLERAKEDEQSIEGTISQDIDLALTEQSTTRRASKIRRASQTVGEVPRRASIHSGGRPEPDRPATATATTATTAPATVATATTTPNVAFDASMYPEMRRHSAHPHRSSLKPVSERRPTGIIINEVEASIKSPYDMKQAIDRTVDQNRLQGLTRPKTDDEMSLQTRGSGSFKGIIGKFHKSHRGSFQKKDTAERRDSGSNGNRKGPGRLLSIPGLPPKNYTENETDTEIYRKYENIFKTIGSNKPELMKKSVTIFHDHADPTTEKPQRDTAEEAAGSSLAITVLWLALNEECEAMVSPHVQRLYVAYSFLGRSGADLETPVSLSKPKHYVDKCHFNFKKTFHLEDVDLPLVGHMARCRAASKTIDPKDCIVFTVISEPPEDPLGLDNCEDIGYAYLYLGDLLAYSAGSPEYTEVTPIRAARGAAPVCGVLAVRVQGLDVVRRCLVLAQEQRDISTDIWSS